MKYCKDCVWWVPKTTTTSEENLDLCMEPTLQISSGISMVTGKPIPARKIWAENERKFGACGEEAKLFQSREQAKEVALEVPQA